MKILTKTANWVKSQIASPSDDFKQAEETPRNPKKTALTATGVGAGVGALAGGAAAYHSVSNDSVHFEYVTELTPLIETGPGAEEIFPRAELARMSSLVAQQSEGAGSYGKSLDALSYLKFQNPKISEAELTGMFNSLESSFGNDGQVRESLNMIAAHINRHGTTPDEAFAEFQSYFGYEEDFSKATQMFVEDQKLTEDYLNEVSVQLAKRHSSPLGHLGMGKAVALGVAGGMAAGAVAGLVTGVGINIYTKLASS